MLMCIVISGNVLRTVDQLAKDVSACAASSGKTIPLCIRELLPVCGKLNVSYTYDEKPGCFCAKYDRTGERIVAIG